MDPSDLEPIRQALASQGVRIGNHDKILREISEKLRQLSTSVTELSTQMSQISNQLSAATAPPSQSGTPQGFSPPPASAAAREPHIPTPERYSGNLGTCGQFLLQCSLVFDLQPTTYNTDKSRIAFIISLLSGRASQWATAVIENNSPVCHSYLEFTKEMRKIFDHPLKGKEAANRLLSLRQGSSSVAQYAIDFRILAAESGWDDTALQGVFMKGLNDRVKDELATRDETNSLEELISLATRLDNRLRERQREKAGRQFLPRVLASQQMSSSTSAPVSPVPTIPPEPTEDEPMQLGRARLTPAERQRRQRSGLCIYCGQAGHYLSSCPQLPKDTAHQ